MFVGRLFLNPMAGGPLMIGFLIIYDALGFMVLCILVSIVVSWARALGASIPRYNKVLSFVDFVAEFSTAPIRRVLPSFRMGAMGFDFSPLIALVALWLLQSGVIQLGELVTR